MTLRAAWRMLREPVAVFGVALVGSAALWGRLWVTSPTTRGVCGCGDPALFQWFLAWPAHAIATGHSLVFSRDLFHPAGINLLANTSVLGLGVPLAPITWLGGPVLTQNVALLLSVPVAASAMDLFLRRVTTSTLARVGLSLFWGFSPFVVANLTEAHLMLAWTGLLPLLALGAWDTVSTDRRRARRGQVLLTLALIVQFFISTELLLLAVLIAVVVAAVLGLTALAAWFATGRLDVHPAGAIRRLAVAVGVAVVVLATPAAYALLGPRSLKGNIWGAGFNPGSAGSSLLDLVRPHAAGSGLVALSGYSGPAVVQAQLVGWGVIALALLAAIWRWRDHVTRTAAIVMVVCLALSLSSHNQPWAPWRWLGTLPVLEDVVQLRIAVFALLAAIVASATLIESLEARKGGGRALAVGALALAVLPVAIPEARGLPLRTVHVAVPAWWRAAPSRGVVLAYPYPGNPLQSPLAWQAHAAFAVSMLGGTGPQGTVPRAGVDAPATALLNALSQPPPFGPTVRPTATPANASLVRGMVERDGVTEVVVPVTIRGGPLVAGRPSPGAAAFFAQVLGEPPTVEHDAWVFAVPTSLAAPRYVPATVAARCVARVATAGPTSLGLCLFGAAR